MRGTGTGGFSLPELVTVMVVFGIMAMIAMPRWEGVLARIRTHGAASRVAADLAYTRQLAARTGRRARLQIEPSRDCPAPRTGAAGHRYRIIVAGPDSVAARVDLRLDAGRVCLTSNQSAAVVFTSSGLTAGFNNRTLSVRQGGHPPAFLTVSSVGRVLRRY
jgi:prepilin-type N-terminal cleavage/methylation domain-containing protein